MVLRIFFIESLILRDCCSSASDLVFEYLSRNFRHLGSTVPLERETSATALRRLRPRFLRRNFFFNEKLIKCHVICCVTDRLWTSESAGYFNREQYSSWGELEADIRQSGIELSVWISTLFALPIYLNLPSLYFASFFISQQERS